MNNLNLHTAKDRKSFVLFKTTFQFEPYLDVVAKFHERSSIAKLRLSAHSLAIESGR